jgi:hypothetical protein
LLVKQIISTPSQKLEQKTSLAWIDNLYPNMTVLTTDTTRFPEFLHQKKDNHFEFIISYKKKLGI